MQGTISLWWLGWIRWKISIDIHIIWSTHLPACGACLVLTFKLWGYLIRLRGIRGQNCLTLNFSGLGALLASFLVVLHFRVWWIYFCWFGFWGCVARWVPGGTGEGGAARMDFLHSSILPYHGYQTITWVPDHTMDTRPYHGYQTKTWIPNHTMDTGP